MVRRRSTSQAKPARSQTPSASAPKIQRGPSTPQNRASSCQGRSASVVTRRSMRALLSSPLYRRIVLERGLFLGRLRPDTRPQVMGRVKRARERTLRGVRQVLLVAPHENHGGEGQDGRERG